MLQSGQVFQYFEASVPILAEIWRLAHSMFGTAPNPDGVSGLANGAMENPEYDLRKQMNRRTSHKMNLNTDFQTWFTISLLWCEIYIEGPIKLFLHSLFWKERLVVMARIVNVLRKCLRINWLVICRLFSQCLFLVFNQRLSKGLETIPSQTAGDKTFDSKGNIHLEHMNILSQFRFANCSNGKQAVL